MNPFERITRKNMKWDACGVTALVLLLSIGGSAVQSANAATPSSLAATSISATQNVAQQNNVIKPVSLVTRVSTAITAGTQYKTTIWLNLRSGAGTNYSIIGSGVAGTTVTATGKTSGIWYEVKLGAQTGWMSSEFLSQVAAAPAPSSSTIPAGTQYKTTIQLNFRSGPGTNYTILGSGVTGTIVTATGKTSGVWYEVKMGSQTGWMSSDYLTKVTAPAPAPAPAAPSVEAVQYKTLIHLNLRSGPSTMNSIIGSGPMGTTVTGTGKTSGIWYEVKMGSLTGWMSSDYLEAITGANSKAALQAFAGSKLGNAQQLQCLVTLWEKESGWNYKALNPAFDPSKPSTPSYQAYGIAQAAPGGRMATSGADWETNPRTQITWGLDYIKGRYGTPCSALTYWNLRGWY